MSVIIVLIIASLIVGVIFVGAFVWAVRAGQYEDTLTPALRVLADDAVQKNLPQAGGSTAPCPASIETTMGRQPTK